MAYILPCEQRLHFRYVSWRSYFSHDSSHSESVASAGTKGFTCGKWFISYNFGIDDGAKSKFGTYKELIALNILKFKDFVIRTGDMSPNHFAKHRK